MSTSDGHTSEGANGSSERASSSSAPQAWRVRAAMRLLWRRTKGACTAHGLAPYIGAVVFVLVAWAIVYELRGFPLGEVKTYLADLPAAYVMIALALTSVNFVVLSGYDALAMRYVGVDLSYKRIAFSAFIGYAFSQAIGNPLLTGGGVRYRMYSSWGLSSAQIGKTILFAGVSFWLGCFALGAFLFLGQPVSLSTLDLPVRPALLGAACLLPTAGYLGVTTLRNRPVTVRGWTFEVPDQWMVPVQVGLAVADLFVAAGVFYVLLPSGADLSYLYLLGVYQIALIAGVLSHVPGGLGVFDGILLLMLKPFLPTSTIVGAILAFRGIFHLLPLTLAAISYMTFETQQVKKKLQEA